MGVGTVRPPQEAGGGASAVGDPVRPEGPNNGTEEPSLIDQARSPELVGQPPYAGGDLGALPLPHGGGGEEQQRGGAGPPALPLQLPPGPRGATQYGLVPDGAPYGDGARETVGQDLGPARIDQEDGPFAGPGQGPQEGQVEPLEAEVPCPGVPVGALEVRRRVGEDLVAASPGRIPAAAPLVGNHGAPGPPRGHVGDEGGVQPHASEAVEGPAAAPSSLPGSDPGRAGAGGAIPVAVAGGWGG